MSTKTAISPSAFELVSGLEIHVQLNTASKIFSADSAAFGAPPNAHISPVSLALPGALPVLNREVTAKAVRMGLALHCSINQLNFFDRKNYFYADLPKGYQITQDSQPVCRNGYIDLQLADGSTRRIGINRIHMEEDAGKSLHDQHEQYSYVDLNRAGVPLIEIVTEPDIRSAEEASLLLTEIRRLVRHLDVSDGNMEEGSLRCDANISIREKGSTAFGTRCEVKNLNSIRNVRRAMEFEFSRQAALVSAGEQIIQSTLTFDAEQGTTAPMRTKEMANDYRYFPDPDLPPVYISDEWLAEIRAGMPALPQEISAGLIREFGLSQAEAGIFADDRALYSYLRSALETAIQPRSLINWLTGPLRAWLNEQQLDIRSSGISPLQLAAVVNLAEHKKITQQTAMQQLIPALAAQPGQDPAELAARLNLLIVDDTAALEAMAAQVLEEFSAQAEAYRKGKKGVLGLFVGAVMKKAGGKADPQLVNRILLEKLK